MGASCVTHHHQVTCSLDDVVYVQGAVVLVRAAASGQCKLQQLQMHECGIADAAFIQKAIQLRAAEALENAKPKKKAKKKKKAGKGKAEAAAGKVSRCAECHSEKPESVSLSVGTPS